MARFKSSIEFIGSVGNLTAYTMKGIDRVIVRSKGGASRDKIKKLESFARTRELNVEWKGCVKAGKSIITCLQPIRHLADYNLIGPLNGIAKKIQKLDTVNDSGERSIDFSKHREILEGFQLNRKNSFDYVVKRAAMFDIDREKGSAFIQFPSLVPGIHLVNSDKAAYFRFIAVLGILSDLEFSGDYAVYSPLNPEAHTKNCYAETDWYPAFEPFGGATLQLSLEANSGDTETLLLAAGIEFGNSLTNGMDRYSGAGKIVAVR